MAMVNDTNVYLFHSMSEMAEHFDATFDESVFPSSRIMFAIRDSFYGNVKYGYEKGKLDSSEIYEMFREEPNVKQNLIYVYCAAYSEWILNQLNIAVPEWCFSPRALSFSDWGLVFASGPKSLLSVSDDLADEFVSRGIYIANHDLSIV